MYTIPGTLQRHTLYYDRLPEAEYDEKGIPYGIQPDYDRPYLDTKGNERYAFVYRPSTLVPMLLTGSLFVVTDETEEQGILELMTDSGLLELSEREKIFLIFPAASAAGWNTRQSPDLPDDIDILNQVQYAARIWFLFPGREKCHEYRMAMIGCGKGATMAELALGRHPEHVHSVLLFRSEAARSDMPDDFSDSEMFVWEVMPKSDGYRFWLSADHLDDVPEKQIGVTSFRADPSNSAKQVRISQKASGQPVDAGLLCRFWDEACSKNARIPGIGNGKVFSFGEVIEKKRPCIHIDDRSLGDNGGMPHHWIEFVPDSVLQNYTVPGYSCPVIIELHGGGSWPETSLVKVQFQDLGEEEGFITVYANASAVNSWNSVFRDDRPNDMEYLTALIAYLCERYPVDPSRVYISGFSNGSGMAHVMAALHPDLIAGAIVFNTRYPVGEALYRKAEEVKKNMDYRVPVFSTYGTKDAEFPMREGCGQFSQMNFWKWYNHIGQKPLDPQDPSGVGCPGDKVIQWEYPDPNGNHLYTTHEFFTRGESGLNLYNYTLVKDLPHTVERGLIREAWNFIRQFSRLEDGTLHFEKGNTIL